jgi:hypothetical protein
MLWDAEKCDTYNNFSKLCFINLHCDDATRNDCLRNREKLLGEVTIWRGGMIWVMTNILGKVTCFITRERGNKTEILLIQHPNAGIQFPAGAVEENEVTRHYYHFRSNCTLNDWEQEADHHLFKLFWSPLDQLPFIVPPQREWLEYVLSELNYTFL